MMASIWSDATGLLEKVAPALASAIGTPLAGVAATAIIGALNLPPDTPPPQISAALSSATPDQLLALKQADNAFRSTMRQLDVDLARIGAADRADARGREISVRDHTPPILAYTLTIGFFGLVWLMVFRPVPADNAAAVNIMLGTLGTAWIAAMSYYFGSTQGSQAKTAMLFQSTPPASVAHQPAPVAQAIQIEAQPARESDAPRGAPSGATAADISNAIEEAGAVGRKQADAVQ